MDLCVFFLPGSTTGNAHPKNTDLLPDRTTGNVHSSCTIPVLIHKGHIVML